MEANVGQYDPDASKFQGATSPAQRDGALWVGVGAVVLLAAEAATVTTWGWLAVSALAAAAVAMWAWRAGGRPAVAIALGLACLSATLGTAAWRTARVATRPIAVATEAVDEATRIRDRNLSAAVARGRRTAAFALQRATGPRPIGAPSLDDLLSERDIERGIVARVGDSTIAIAGPLRIRPLTGSDAAVITVTPFGHFLTLRESSGRIEIQVTLLLDAAPALPAAGRSLADGAGGWQRVRWVWDAPEGATVYASIDAAIDGVRRTMRPVVPAPADLSAREARLARFLAAVGLGVLALLILLTATLPVARAAAVLVPLWAVSRIDVAPAGLGPTALKALAASAAMLFAAIMLWRRPARRTPVGMIAAVLLLASAAPLIVLVGRNVLPDVQPASLITWFWWQVMLAIATAAFLAAANAPLRATDDPTATPTWGLAAALSAGLIGAIGIEAWLPTTAPVGAGGIAAWTPSRWAGWYPMLWLVPFGCLLPRTSPRARMLAIATTAGVLATLVTWSESLDVRLRLAQTDIARLKAPQDLASTAALAQFATESRPAHPTRIDRLYAAWRASAVAQLGLPTHLALWTGNGQVRESIALDSLSMTWGDLETLVRERRAVPTSVSLRRGAVHHEVLVLPLAPDTIATVTIGPSSRVVAPTRFGRYVGWRSPPDPAFRLSIEPTRDAVPDSTFRRNGRWLRADWYVASGDAPRVVRATIEMATPRPFAVRAALSVLLDVLLILAAWLTLEQLLGRSGAIKVGVFRRSYRRTVAAALAGFFIVPALFFTLWSLLRLRGDASVARMSDVTRTLRDVAFEGGFALAALTTPDPDSLRRVADALDVDMAIYRDGRLVAASTPLLVELGFIAAAVPPLPALGASGEVAVRRVFAGSPVRLGVEAADDPATLVAVLLPGTEAELARDQLDLALLLLLVSLTGALAAVSVAGLVARALGQPIETLRRTAVAIGRRESPPPHEHVPAEFAPVFQAIDSMERELRARTAELEVGRARTSAILSTVATGVIGVDADGKVIHANPRAEELLGRPVETGAPLGLQLPVEWQAVADGVSRLLGPTTRDAESREVEIDDRRFAVTLAPLGDGGLVLALTDITEASRAARVVAWGEMARQVAHEIKNPLTPMRLGLQHLRRVQADGHADLPRVLDETVSRLLAEIDRLDLIARSFARYGSPPEDRAAPLETIALREVVEELAGLFALTTAEPRLVIRGGEGIMVLARREELIQVLLNLLDNARHAGARVVTLTLGDAMLEVRDDGGGIAAEQLPRIFEPSFSTTTSGTGLGLAIVRRLVDGWSGTIAAESGPGQGAVFTIRFAPAGLDRSTPATDPAYD